MPVKKVLVIRFRRIGDAVLSVVICSTIRKSFPGAEIHYVVNDYIEPLFRDHPDVDRVITFSNRENDHFFTYWAKVRRLMRKERYDVIIDTRSTLKTLWFSICRREQNTVSVRGNIIIFSSIIIGSRIRKMII